MSSLGNVEACTCASYRPAMVFLNRDFSLSKELERSLYSNGMTLMGLYVRGSFLINFFRRNLPVGFYIAPEAVLPLDHKFVNNC